MKVIFHPEAREEFRASVLYYEECVVGLGADFRREVFTVVQNILKHPNVWPDVDGGIRRCLIPRFPYAVLYGTTSEELFIYAVMNLHRHPDYWKRREK